jgi:hypothetical protein
LTPIVTGSLGWHSRTRHRTGRGQVGLVLKGPPLRRQLRRRRLIEGSQEFRQIASCDPAANAAGRIRKSKIALYIIPTDEELMIAHTRSLLAA